MKTKLSEALLNAQRSVAGVEKNARNDFAKYDYVSADGMVGQLRNALLDNGLVFSRTSWGIVEDRVVSVFDLTHVESGETQRSEAAMPIVETKGRPADKAVLGALTTCLSYVLRDLLLVPRVDELEIDNRANDDVVARKRVPAPASAPSPVGGSAADAVIAKVKVLAASRADGEAWIESCLQRASEVEGRQITRLSQMPVGFLEKMAQAPKGDR